MNLESHAYNSEIRILRSTDINSAQLLENRSSYSSFGYSKLPKDYEQALFLRKSS